MPIDPKVNLVFPDKTTQGENWRKLEVWARPVWTKITPINGWAVVAGATQPAYCIDGFGMLHMRGQLNATGAGVNNVFFNLPVGVTPAVQYNFVGLGVSGGAALTMNVTVTTTGTAAAFAMGAAPPALNTFTVVIIDCIHASLLP